MSFHEDGIAGRHWLREDEDAMMRTFHRIVTENSHLRWEADWIRRVYDRYAKKQELAELVRSELKEETEEVDDSVDYEGWIAAGYLAEYDVGRWLDEYERLGFLDEPDPWEAVGH